MLVGGIRSMMHASDTAIGHIAPGYQIRCLSITRDISYALLTTLCSGEALVAERGTCVEAWLYTSIDKSENCELRDFMCVHHDPV